MMVSPTIRLGAEEQTTIQVKHIVLGYTWTLGSRVLSLAFGALAAVLIPRWLGPKEYGYFSWVISVASFFLVFADFGISPSTARYVAQYHARKSEAVPLIVLHGLRLGILFNLIFALGNWVAAPWIVERFASESLLWPLRFASFYIIATSLKAFVEMTLQGLQRLDLMAIASLVGSVVKALLSVGLVYIGLGVGGAIVGQVAGLGLAFVFGGAMLYRCFRGQIPREVKQPFFSRQIFAYGLPMMLTGISFYIYTQSDSFLIQHFKGAEQVGYYAMPLQLVTLMIFPAGALGMTVAPMMARLQERGQSPGRLLSMSIRYTLILFVPLATGLFILARQFIGLFYGDGYLPSVPVLRIYMPFFVLFALSSVLSLSMNFLGLANQRAKVVFTAALLKILLALIVIPLAGIVGAATVALVTYVGVLAMYLVIIVRYCGVESRALFGLGWRILASAIATAGVTTLSSSIATTRVGFGIVVLLGLFVFLVMLLALGGIRKHDWQMLRAALTQRETSRYGITPD